MKISSIIAGSLIILSCVFSCAPVRTVVPLEKDRTHITASIGGPLIEFSGAVIPVPLTSINMGHGLGHTTTLNTALHTTSLIFGVTHIEASVTQLLYFDEAHRFGFSTTPGFYLMTEFKKETSKFYPMLDVNFYVFQKNKNNFAYYSLQQMFELSSTKAFDQKQESRYIPTFAAGYTFSRKKMNYTYEVKYISFFRSNENIVVDYISPGIKGALGIQFGVTRKF